MLSKKADKLMNDAAVYAFQRGQEFVTTDHVFLFLLRDEDVRKMFLFFGVDVRQLEARLVQWIDENTSVALPMIQPQVRITSSVQQLLTIAVATVQSAQRRDLVDPMDLLVAIFSLDGADHQCKQLLLEVEIQKIDVLSYLSHGEGAEDVLPEENYKTTEGKTRPLPDFITNLNERAKAGHVDKLIGRSNEIERVLQTLVRRKKNNPLLVGEAGVGKTAIAEGLALKILKGEVPEKIKSCTVFSLDVGAMLAGTKFRGDFEDRMKNLLKILRSQKDIILFVDEIHQLVGAGSTAGGGTDASNMLKPLLASGSIKVMGSTTYKEYRNVFEKDAALTRRFEKIDVLEPTQEETLLILEGLKEDLEKFHGVVYEPESLRAAVDLSVKHLPGRFLPDKAIALLDDAGARLSLKLEEGSVVGPVLIEKIVASQAKIPEKTVSSTQKEKLMNLERDLKLAIFGQDRAVATVVDAIQLSRAGLKAHEKPLGSFLFVGPTGVGKTELAKQLAQNLGVPLLRFDMSEYMEKQSVSRLTGASPGYVGYEDGGQLTEAVIKHPYSVVLLDEIEKAHGDIYNLLLQIMDYGTLTDNNGRKALFKNCVVIMTSNVGAREMSKKPMGLGNSGDVISSKADEAVAKVFSPEFRNRLDAIVHFQSLDSKQILSVVDKLLAELDVQLQERKVSIIYEGGVKEYLAKKGFDPVLGARPMGRCIDEVLKKPLAREINFGGLQEGGIVTASLKNEAVVFDIKKLSKRKKKVADNV